MTNYNIDGSFAITAALSTAETRKSLADTAVVTTTTIATDLAHTITLSTMVAAAATITETTQGALTLSTKLPMTAAITPALYPPIDSFTVTMDLTAIVADYTDADLLPDRQPISCTVTFTPRLKTGQIVWIPGIGIALAPIQARCDTDGVLRTIVGGNGVELIANTPILGLDQLIYDVAFTNVVYNKADQQIAPFAFEAPVTAGLVVDLSRVTKLPPLPPSWYPKN